jgi:hypothetical protein
MADEQAASNLQKRRGIIGMVTRLDTRVKDLEAAATEPGTVDHTKQLVAKLENLDGDFKTHHFQLIDLIKDTDLDALDKEQDVFDRFDDDVTSLMVRLQQLLSAKPGSSSPSINQKTLLRKLSHLEKKLESIDEDLTANPDDASLIEQHQEQSKDYKKELAIIYEDLLALGIEDDDDLIILHSRLEKVQFSCSLKTKKLLSSLSVGSTAAPVADGKGVRLPKIDVPTFDGDVLNWRQFWEQFSVSIHERKTLSNAEKFQHAVKGGSARNAIEWLSRSGDHYPEAIECLRSGYDRPHTIHRGHVQRIMDAPSLKDGSGKELRHLHDVIQQHIRALKSLDYEPSGAFVTSIIELKLDQDTMFEWQRQSQSKTGVPHYQDLLGFLDLRAQASETSLPSTGRRTKRDPRKKSNETVTSFVANPVSGGTHYILCEADKHPLYVCAKFKSLGHSDKLSMLKSNGHCTNCLRQGHSVKNCRSSH